MSGIYNWNLGAASVIDQAGTSMDFEKFTGPFDLGEEGPEDANGTPNREVLHTFAQGKFEASAFGDEQPRTISFEVLDTVDNRNAADFCFARGIYAAGLPGAMATVDPGRMVPKVKLRLVFSTTGAPFVREYQYASMKTARTTDTPHAKTTLTFECLGSIVRS